MKLHKMIGVLVVTILCMETSFVYAETVRTKTYGYRKSTTSFFSPAALTIAYPTYWHVDVGFLYEKIKISGASLVVGSIPQDFDYTFGVTASLGRSIRYRECFFGVNFNWLKASKKHMYSDGETKYQPNEFFDTMILAGSGFVPEEDFFTSIVYNTAIIISDIDIVISPGSFYFLDYSLEPSVGVGVLWFTIRQTTKNYSDNFTDPLSYAVFKDVQNNWGVGPLFGLSAEYHLFPEFSFFFDSKVSALYGRAYKVTTPTLHGSQFVNVNKGDRATSIIKREYYFPLRSIFGIKCSHCCSRGDHYIAFKLGYDFRMLAFIQNGEKGFVINGLYTSFMWDF